jgi:hypothetical protein
MPYLPTETLQAMHCERFADDVAGRRPNPRRDDRPDPLGLALSKLHRGLWLHDGVTWLGRIDRLAVARPRRWTA